MRLTIACASLAGFTALVLLTGYDLRLQEVISQSILAVFGFGNAMAAIAAFLLADLARENGRSEK